MLACFLAQSEGYVERDVAAYEHGGSALDPENRQLRAHLRTFFPKTQLVADKFHVLRLLTPAIHRALRALNLPKEALPMYRVLRKNPSTLTPTWRWKLRCWLADKPVLRELCAAHEAIFSLYRVRGHGRASKALTRFTDTLALSSVPELKTLRTTLMHHGVRRAASTRARELPPQSKKAN